LIFWLLRQGCYLPDAQFNCGLTEFALRYRGNASTYHEEYGEVARSTVTPEMLG
jgi:hypothetical protein